MGYVMQFGINYFGIKLCNVMGPILGREPLRISLV